jgi:phosphatidylglycerophosphatase A
MNDRPSTTPATGRKTLWAWAVGTFFGTGLLKRGPGTWGSVAAVLLWMVPASVDVWVKHMFIVDSSGSILHGYVLPSLTLLAAIVATAVGIPAATIVARESGREDPGHVVIDEVAGQWLTLVVCRPDWPHALLALTLFRLFDITKPWPVRWADRNVAGGLGVMADDILAALYAGSALLLLRFIGRLVLGS